MHVYLTSAGVLNCIAECLYLDCHTFSLVERLTCHLPIRVWPLVGRRDRQGVRAPLSTSSSLPTNRTTPSPWRWAIGMNYVQMMYPPFLLMHGSVSVSCISLFCLLALNSIYALLLCAGLSQEPTPLHPHLISLVTKPRHSLKLVKVGLLISKVLSLIRRKNFSIQGRSLFQILLIWKRFTSLCHYTRSKKSYGFLQ